MLDVRTARSQSRYDLITRFFASPQLAAEASSAIGLQRPHAVHTRARPHGEIGRVDHLVLLRKSPIAGELEVRSS